MPSESGDARPEPAVAAGEPWALVFEGNPLPMWIFDRESLRFLAVNDAAVRHYGWSREEFLTMSLRDIRPPDDVPALLDDIAGHHEQLHGGVMWRHLKKSGEQLWVDITAQGIVFKGCPARLVMAHDVTARVQAVQAVARSEDRWERLFAASATGIASASPDGAFLSANPAFCALVQRPWAELAGLHMLSFTHADDAPGCLAQLERLAHGELQSFSIEKRYLRPNGQAVWARASVTMTERTAGEAPAFVAVVQDIDAQRSDHAALVRQHALAALAGRMARLGGWEVSLPDRQLHWTEELREIMDVPADGAPTVEENLAWYLPESRERVTRALEACLETGQGFDLDLHLVTPKGRQLTIHVIGEAVRDAAGRIVGARGAGHDLTERNALQAQLQQAQRLEAVGQLTGGIAHDFNNLLTVILGNADLLAEQLSDRADLRPLAEMTRAAAERGAELTQRLLAFARRQALQPQFVDAHQLLASMDTLIRRTLPADIDLELVRAAGLWPALADPAQLESAVLNLVLNARDAMPGGGRLTLETANAWVDQHYADQHAEVTPGQYVLLSVSDTGCGMNPAQLARAFEPFYTTKGAGKGTGLGLSMVYGFAKQSRGHVKLYSEPGEGTTVRLYLPRATGDKAQVAAPTTASRSLHQLRGQALVLVVEDDALVRRHVADQLASLGYRVLQAAQGHEGLALLQQHDDVDLLFTDVVMPGGMNGRELAEAARALRPGLKVLYTSGYTENAIVHHGRLDPGVQLLPKPYRNIDLAAKVHAVLQLRVGGDV